MQICLTNTLLLSHQLSINNSHDMFVQEIRHCESECAYAVHVEAHVKINAQVISVSLSSPSPGFTHRSPAPIPLLVLPKTKLNYTVNGECSVGEKFCIFRAWCGNRKTFTPVWKWCYSSTLKTVWSANTTKLFCRYTDIYVMRETFLLRYIPCLWYRFPTDAHR